MKRSRMEKKVGKRKNQDAIEMLRSIRKLDKRIRVAKNGDRRILLTLKMEMVILYLDLLHERKVTH